MKLHHLGLATALFAGLAFPGGARASHCGACNYPTAGVCAEQCCPPVVRYRVCYQPVDGGADQGLLPAGPAPS